MFIKKHHSEKNWVVFFCFSFTHGKIFHSNLKLGACMMYHDRIILFSVHGNGKFGISNQPGGRSDLRYEKISNISQKTFMGVFLLLSKSKTWTIPPRILQKIATQVLVEKHWTTFNIFILPWNNQSSGLKYK